MARALDALWADYEDHHRAAGNKRCHLAGIPLIVFSLLSLAAAPVGTLAGVRVEAALLLVLAASSAYVWLAPKLGLAMAAVLLLFYAGARLVDWRVALGLFVAGWVLQFIGHGVYEKRAPAFFGNLAHLLVGPLWVLNHFVPLHRKKSQAGPSLRSG